jgi:hypothetical protein
VKRAAEFWSFVRERHAIYVRRFVARRFPPWTDDPVLASVHFTNVYRELDPGTVYIRGQLRAHRSSALAEKVLNVTMYRLCMHERSFSAVGWTPLPFDPVRWVQKVSQTDKPFHGAYYIHNLGLKVPKAEAMGMVAAYLAEYLSASELPVDERKSFIQTMAGVKGIGGFISTQVLADLTYDQHVPLPIDGWVALGPGAMRGLALVAGRSELSTVEAEAQLQELWDEQPEPTTERPHITRMNLQNCCCEFSKYCRVASGGRPRRLFDCAGAWSRDGGGRAGNQTELEI